MNACSPAAIHEFAHVGLLGGKQLPHWHSELPPLFSPASAAVHMQVVAGTSKLVLTVSMLGTALSFLVTGHLNVPVASAYAAVNVAFTPLGIWAMDRIVRKTGHPSLLTALSLVRFLACAAVQLVTVAAPALVALARDKPSLAGFHPEALCGTKQPS